MKILVVGLVRNEQFKRLKEEGEKRGHEVDGCYVSQLVIEASDGRFSPTLRGKSMENYDLLFHWALGSKRWEWYTVSLFLKEKYKTTIVNEKAVDKEYNYYLTPASDYWKQVENNLPFPKSAVFFSARSVDSVIGEFDFPLILKSSSGRQGKGVYKIESKEELVEKVEELEKDKKAIILREFIPNDGDIRIFTVGYKAIGAMKRTPPEGDFRSNISQGGSGSEFDLESNSKIKELAEKVSKVTRTEVAGVDIMINKKTGRPYVLEINPGPQFTGLEKYTNTNAAEEIIKYFEILNNS